MYIKCMWIFLFFFIMWSSERAYTIKYENAVKALVIMVLLILNTLDHFLYLSDNMGSYLMQAATFGLCHDKEKF